MAEADGSGQDFRRRHRAKAPLEPASWADRGNAGKALCGATIVDQELVDRHHEIQQVPSPLISAMPMCLRCGGMIPPEPGDETAHWEDAAAYLADSREDDSEGA